MLKILYVLIHLPKKTFIELGTCRYVAKKEEEQLMEKRKRVDEEDKNKQKMSTSLLILEEMI